MPALRSTTSRSLPVNALMRRLVTTMSFSCGAIDGFIFKKLSVLILAYVCFGAANILLLLLDSSVPGLNPTRT